MFNNVYLKDLNTTVFDIETTGLFHSRDCIINAGFCSSMGDVWQNFTEDPADEKRVVAEALERIAEADAVITYNGDTFDLPFLLRRAQKYGLCEKLPLLWSIDLYRWLKKYWPLAPSMRSLSQKSVEEAMGLSDKRDDSGARLDGVPMSPPPGLPKRVSKAGEAPLRADRPTPEGTRVRRTGRKIPRKCRLNRFVSAADRKSHSSS